MRKWILAFLILVLPLILTGETVGQVFTNRLVSTNFVVGGRPYLAFDLNNSQILQARLKKFNVVYRPWDNPPIEELFTQIEKDKKKKKILLGIVGAETGVIVLALLLGGLL